MYIKKVLFLYTSYEGQTKKIAHTIAKKLEESSNFLQIDYDILELTDNIRVDLADYQFVVIGSSIRYGHHHRYVTQFIRHYSDALNQMKSAFFSVNLTARKPDKQSVNTNPYSKKLLNSLRWQPTISAVFAGALYYPRYRWFDRITIKFIMWITGGVTDTTKEVEYTDWVQVNEFAHKISQYI